MSCARAPGRCAGRGALARRPRVGARRDRAGKTVTQAALAEAYILAGLPVIVIDPKGDPYLRAVLRGAARRAGKRFVEWSPTGPNVYNPVARGGPTEIADKCLAGQRWTEPHYEMATQRLLDTVMKTMRGGGTVAADPLPDRPLHGPRADRHPRLQGRRRDRRAGLARQASSAEQDVTAIPDRTHEPPCDGQPISDRPLSSEHGR